MKKIPTIQFVFVVLCVWLAASDGLCEEAVGPAPLPKADPLLPESDGQLIARIQQLFDELAARRPDYGLTVKSVTAKAPPGLPSMIGGTIHTYRIAPPHYVSVRLAELGFGKIMPMERTGHWKSQLHAHLLASEHSFDAAVLAISARYVTPHPSMIGLLLDGERDAWQAGYRKYANLFAGVSVGQINPYRDRRYLFLRLLGERCERKVLDAVKAKGPRAFIGRANAADLYLSSTSGSITNTAECRAVGAIVNSAEKPAREEFEKLAVDPETLVAWSYFVLNADGEEARRYAELFIAYADAHPDDSATTFAAWIAALMRVVGYRFDGLADTYEITPVGSVYLEWLIRHRDGPEAARIIGHLHAHGAAEIIDDLVRKVHGVDGWLELAK